MAITIPDRKQIRITTRLAEPHNGQTLPYVAEIAMTNPGPVVVGDTSPNAAGQGRVKPATHALKLRYVGYNLRANTPIGAPTEVIRNCIVDGFAGMTPGLPLFINTTTADAGATDSGLVHVDPGDPAAGTGGRVIGVALSATKAVLH